MTHFFSGFFISFLLTALSTPLAIILAKRFKLLDDPKKRPHPAHVQKRVVPRAGGIPIYIGIILSILIFLGFNSISLGIILCLTILLTTGIIDDARTSFKPWIRLLLQLLVAIIAVLLGIGIDFITNPLGGILYLNTFSFGLLGAQINIIADLFAIIWIVWMMNMINWSKGVDGQMPAITLIAFLTVGFVSWNFYNLGDQNQLFPTALAFICAGSALGFLIFNWHPAKIFPGFSGSTILGFMIAVLSIYSSAKLAIALLVLLVPAVDFFYTFFRRILEKQSPLRGDQKHLHHLLLQHGWSHSQIALLYGFSCAILGVLAANLNSQGKIFTIVVAGVVIFGTILWLHLLRDRDTKNEDE